MQTILFGVGVWAVPFLVGMLLFPIQEPSPTLFETIVSIALVCGSTLFSALHIKKAGGVTTRSAVTTGVVWACICVLIDYPILVRGFGMDAMAYVGDIGLTYLMIPVILSGIAYTARIYGQTGNQR